MYKHMYKRILVAVDGSPTAYRGLDEAIRLAKAAGSEILLLHVFESLLPMTAEGDWAMPPIPAETFEELGRHLLYEALARVKAAGLAAETRLVDGAGRRIGPLISAEAEAWPADLVVLGSHGRRGLDHLLLGSVAEGVIRTCGVPILLVRASA